MNGTANYNLATTLDLAEPTRQLAPLHCRVCMQPIDVSLTAKPVRAAFGLYVDKDTKQLRVGGPNGIPINVTATEYAIVETLMDRLGRTVSYHEIIVNAFGEEYGIAPKNTYEHMVRTNIARIRTARLAPVMGADGRRLARLAILNRRNFGYMIPTADDIWIFQPNLAARMMAAIQLLLPGTQHDSPMPHELSARLIEGDILV